MKDWYSYSEPELLQEIGLRTRLRRIEQNLTQEMLAQKVGLNRATIRDLENGKSVHLLSFVSILRGLNLLDKLPLLIPGPDDSPILANLQSSRKRVKLSKS